MRDERLPAFPVFFIPLVKKGMRIKILFLTAFVIVSCGLSEIGRRPHDGDDGVWTGPGTGAGSQDPGRASVYVTAMDYPAGYNWRTDPEKGSVKCSLVVFADGSPVLKIPVGDVYEVSSDPESHHMAGGHLYTDYSDGEQTVVRKDGKEIMRFLSDEKVCGLLVEDQDVYTLSHRKDSGGFRFRKNDEVLLERPSGRTFGNLYHDGDSICFAFVETFEGGGDSLERYYHVADGHTEQVALREDVKKVWDVVSCKGKLYYLASLIGIGPPVLFSEDKKFVLEMPYGVGILSGGIITDGEGLCVEGVFQVPGKIMQCGLWNRSGKLCVSWSGMSLASVCVDGDALCCMVNRSALASQGMIYRCGEVFDAPADYYSTGNGAVLMTRGMLHIGMSSLKGERPLVWKDGFSEEIKAHGFITSVSAVED